MFAKTFDRYRKVYNFMLNDKIEKHNRKSYTTNNQKGTIAIIGNSIKLPKVGRVKAVIYKHPEADWIIKSATFLILASSNWVNHLWIDLLETPWLSATCWKVSSEWFFLYWTASNLNCLSITLFSDMLTPLFSCFRLVFFRMFFNSFFRYFLYLTGTKFILAPIQQWLTVLRKLELF